MFKGTQMIDPKKGSVGRIVLGDSISKVLSHIQINVQTYGRIEIVSSKEEAKQPTFIILSDSGFKLKFDSKFQKLELIEIYVAQEEQKKKLLFVLREQNIIPGQTAYSNMNNLMGPTYPPRILGNSVLLSYEEGRVSFVFEYSEKEFKEGTKELTHDQLLTQQNSLVKINMQRDAEQADGNERRIKIVLNEGIEIYKPNESDCIQILFGDHLMDVVRILGNPNKEFHNEGKLFLNYLELGFDLMVDQDYTLKKIILHTNFPYHPQFGFHNRCYYELDLSSMLQNSKVDKNLMLEEEIKEQPELNGRPEVIKSNLGSKENKKKKNKKNRFKDKVNFSQILNKDNQQQLSGNILITPLTKFTAIREAFNDIQSDEKQDQFFVRNITNEFSTQYHAYKSIIFEVMPDCGDYIASVTLFKTNE